MVLDDRCGPPSVGRRHPTRHRRDLLAAGLSDDAWDNEASAAMLESLPERFTDDDFEQAVGRLPADLLTRTTTQRTLDELRRATRADYAVTFPAGLPCTAGCSGPRPRPSPTAWRTPVSSRSAMRTAGESYRATYTAYDGRHIRSHQVASDDLRHFEITPMRGPASANKGMALFPRQVAGRTLALCRSDGETIGLTTLDGNHMWQPPAPLHTPRHGWSSSRWATAGRRSRRNTAGSS